MEEKKKSKQMIILSIVLAIVVIIAIVEGIVIFTSNSKNKDNGTLTSESCIGTWKTLDNTTMCSNVETFILYQGGTGKGIMTNKPEDKGYYAIKWEVKDNILNISLDSTRKFCYGIYHK